MRNTERYEKVTKYEDQELKNGYIIFSVAAIGWILMINLFIFFNSSEYVKKLAGINLFIVITLLIGYGISAQYIAKKIYWVKKNE